MGLSIGRSQKPLRSLRSCTYGESRGTGSCDQDKLRLSSPLLCHLVVYLVSPVSLVALVHWTDLKHQTNQMNHPRVARFSTFSLLTTQNPELRTQNNFLRLAFPAVFRRSCSSGLFGFTGFFGPGTGR